MDKITTGDSHLAHSNATLEQAGIDQEVSVSGTKKVTLSDSDATIDITNLPTCQTVQAKERTNSQVVTREVDVLTDSTANYLTDNSYFTTSSSDSIAPSKIPAALFSSESIKECDSRREELIKNYLEGNTKKFTDSEWLYLIFKFGKLRFSKCRSCEWKKEELMELYQEHGEKFLFLRSKLMMLHTETIKNTPQPSN